MNEPRYSSVMLHDEDVGLQVAPDLRGQLRVFLPSDKGHAFVALDVICCGAEDVLDPGVLRLSRRQGHRQSQQRGGQEEASHDVSSRLNSIPDHRQRTAMRTSLRTAAWSPRVSTRST